LRLKMNWSLALLCLSHSSLLERVQPEHLIPTEFNLATIGHIFPPPCMSAV
jgi:hypothetical protein